MEAAKEQIRVSVRALVEFILRSGNIDNRHHASPENAMQEGSRIHRMIQKRMGADYQAEVTLRYTHPTDRYVLVLEGRADGIIDTPTEKLVDEIKGTYRELSHMKEPNPVHLAQAKCYAYIYSLQKEIQVIQVRMTYCHLETEEIRYFLQEYTFEELQLWFGEVLNAYLKWADYEYEWKQIRNESIRNLQFPFPYREGQKELVTYVYQTIYHKRKLFLEAPTGVGKTISTVFPAIKAMEKGMGDKIFYFTAKTITRTVADQTFRLLREKALHFKSVILTAKEKICFMEQVECNPEHCPYAKGHFDRINDAMYDLLTHEESFDREKIETYAHKHQVCPFEFCLDMSLYADGVICDYNYLFDP
ncbi:MAG: DEAD/DEAH box helicase family protein, partial [Lachnospiraceae bacterium]|nr:DEAD/DEAH box helicase family protein [Lachnospiraceae bacterium]